MSQDRVSVQVEGGVAHVRLNRPDKLNALDSAMFDGLVAAADDVAADPRVRVVVLSGEGRAFCAGLDFASFMGMDRDDPGANLLAPHRDSPANRAQSAGYVWHALSVPVIAAIQGVAFGGGLQIAMGADIRFIHPDAEMSVMEIKWGLIPDMSGTQMLRHVIPMDVAKELTFTGRRVSGKEACEIGLATHCVDDPLAAASALAEEIATKSPHAVQAGKALMNRAYTDDPVEGLKNEERVQRTLIGTPNQLEAVQANMEKRAPDFTDPES